MKQAQANRSSIHAANLRALCQAMLLLHDAVELEKFLKDLCTPQELRALAERWRVCQLLEQGNLSYRDIHQLTGTSLVTIARVARFLKTEQHQGYRLVIDRMNSTDADHQATNQNS